MSDLNEDDLLEKYNFLDPDGYLLPPDHPIIIESVDRLFFLRRKYEHDSHAPTMGELIELEDLDRIHRIYKQNLDAYAEEHFGDDLCDEPRRGSHTRSLVDGDIASSDDDDDDYDYDGDDGDDEDEYDGDTSDYSSE